MLGPKVCAHCKELLPYDSFAITKRGALESYCRPCRTMLACQAQERRRQADPAGEWAKKVLRTAKARSPDKFDLTEEFLRALLIANGPCCRWPGCGLRFATTIGKRRAARASVDRIDPTKGYVQDNVQILCHRCNGRKSDMRPSDARHILAQARDPLHIDLAASSEWALWA